MPVQSAPALLRIAAAAFVVCLLFGPLPALAQEAAAPPPAPLILVFDASGSMWGQIEGENKIVIARRVLGELIDELPAASPVALVAYGHRKEGDCADIETVVPLAPLERGSLKAAVAGLQPKGKTPITASIEQALEMVETSAEQATVILLSDGLETCGGDPCKTVRLAKEAGAQMLLHVVGFDVEGEDLSQLQCMAQAGGGLFLSASDAGELSQALETAVALPVDLPAGRLAVHTTADGQLQDASIRVENPATGEEVVVTRTYETEATNPSSIPLLDGTYDVTVLGIGIKGDRRRAFTVEIEGGQTVEKSIDFSTGELRIGVKRNGQLGDAVYFVKLLGGGQQVTTGRTRVSSKTNPAKVRLTAGRYEVFVKPVDFEGAQQESLGTVEVPPQGQQEVKFEYQTGTLRVGAEKSGELADVTVHVYPAGKRSSVAQSRMRATSQSNPKSFELAPGVYILKAKTIAKPRQEKEFEVRVEAGSTVTHTVSFD